LSVVKINLVLVFTILAKFLLHYCCYEDGRLMVDIRYKIIFQV